MIGTASKCSSLQISAVSAASLPGLHPSGSNVRMEVELYHFESVSPGIVQVHKKASEEAVHEAFIFTPFLYIVQHQSPKCMSMQREHRLHCSVYTEAVSFKEPLAEKVIQERDWPCTHTTHRRFPCCEGANPVYFDVLSASKAHSIVYGTSGLAPVVNELIGLQTIR